MEVRPGHRPRPQQATLGREVDQLDGRRFAEHGVELVDPVEQAQGGVQACLLLLEPLLLLRDGLLEAVGGGGVDVQAHLAQRYAGDAGAGGSSPPP